ncbi:MAG: TonB-dependent receptor, partial [Pseudomonadota bacterium]
PRADAAAAGSVVRPADSPHAIDDLGSLLLEVPGVTVARTGSPAAFSTIALRGSNPDEVLIVLDGVPLNVAEGGGVDVSTLPLGDVERVEVYRGTSPLAFAESALGGVVSIVTRTPAANRLTAQAGAGSFGTRYGDVTAGGRVGRLRLYLGAHGLASRGDYAFHNDNGTPVNLDDDFVDRRHNNDSREGNGVLRAALTLAGRRTLNLGLVGFARAQGLPGSQNYPTMLARFHTARGLGTLRYESRDDLGPGGRLSVQGFTSLQRDRLLDPAGEIEGRGPVTVHETTISTGLMANASRPAGEWGRVAAVLEGRRETYTPVDEMVALRSGLPARRLVGVAGVELDAAIRPLDLHLIPSIRGQLLDDVVTGVSAGAMALPATPVVRFLPTLRLGLLRALGPQATAKANVGHYERAPSFLELYGNGDQRLLGDPRLVPERGTNADVALWIDHAGRSIGVASRTTLFGALTDDLITWIPNAQGISRAANISRARVYGVEQELRVGLGSHARIVAQGTITAAEDRSESSAARGRQLPHHPRYLAYVRAQALRLPLGGTWQGEVYADATVLAGDYDDPNNASAVPSRALLGAGASVLWRRAGLRATASVFDLADAQPFDFTYWPLPGRSFFVTIAFDSAAVAPDSGFPSSTHP